MQARTITVARTRRHETDMQKFIRLMKRAGRKFLKRHIVKLIFIGLPMLGMILGIFIGMKVTNYSQSVKLNDYGRVITYKSYTVKSGDTIWGIASDLAALNPEYNDIRQYVIAIQKANGLYGSDLKAGQIISIPYYISPNGTNYNEIYNKYGIGYEETIN